MIARQFLLPLYLFLFILFGCEDTNVALMADAAKDAVTAVTLTDEKVVSLAQQAARVVDQKNKVAPPGSSYTQRLIRLTKKYRLRDSVHFNYKVYLTKDINAFAMADGTIRVNSGLMDLMNDEEVLFVIGHEMGHVVHNHSRKKVVMAYGASALRKGLASQQNEVGQIAGSVLGGLAERLANAQFSQHEEREADRYGVSFLKAEGFNPKAAVTALEKLADLARRHTVLSSHPDPGKRAKTILSDPSDQKPKEQSYLQQTLEIVKNIAIKIIGILQSLFEWFKGS